MNGSSHDSSRGDTSRALPPDMRERLGEVRFRLIMRWISEVTGQLDHEVSRLVTSRALVLDAGANRGDPDLPALTAGKLLIAGDADFDGLCANCQTDCRVQMRLDSLPFAGGSIDTVVTKFTVEHLPDPLGAFREFRRVLRPGGAVAILTPNRASVFVLLSTIVPFRLKQLVKKRLFGGHEADTYPALYRANTQRALRRMMFEAGFSDGKCRFLAGMWVFFSFCAPLAGAVRLAEHLQTRLPLLRNASTYILGTWRVP